MICELSIRNFALIDELSLSFAPGFTVLTGETGAGKSIIIDAINAVLGERVGADSIRGGQAKALIEAVFDLSDAPRAARVLAESGLGEDGENLVILSRDIASGRSTYRVNHRVSTQTLVQEIGRHLVDIHGQHEHQTLIHEQNHLGFLDAFGGGEHQALISAYEAEHDGFVQAREALEQLRMDERDRAQRLDMLRFQVGEIERAELSVDEEETLAAEKSRLQHAEKLREAARNAIEILDGDLEGALAALPAVQTAERELAGVAELDETLAQVAQDLGTAQVLIDEASHALRGHLDELEADPERLEQVEQRLADMTALKRKYGDSLTDVIAFGEAARSELAELENVETREENLRRQLQQRRKQAGAAAGNLSEARQKLAVRLKKAVESELSGLGMAEPTLDIELAREDQEGGLLVGGGSFRATRRGIDICRFLFSANPGEPVKRLSKVASGGELSRLMLVFKSVCSRGAEIPTIIFDEVDAGIGGRVAHAVGERVVGVSSGCQVLCVTHLPQIARLADNQVLVSKVVGDGRTSVRTDRLDAPARVAELARMLGADEDDETARRHAEELLREGEADREQIKARSGAA